MSQSEPISRPILLTAMVIGVAALGLFLRTLHPGVGPSFDSIEIQTAALLGGIIHPPGSPQALMLGHAVMQLPLGPNAAWRLNLLSALSAAGMVAVVFLITYRLTYSPLASGFAALSLAIAPRIWYQASITELYALNALYLAGVFYLLLAWHQTEKPGFFWGATVVYALSFGNHHSMILFLPVYLLVVWRTDRRMLFSLPNFAIAAGIVVIAALQYLYIPLRMAANPPFCNYCTTALPDYLTGGPFKGAMFGVPWPGVLARLPESMAQLTIQFMPWGVLLGVLGGAALFRRNRLAFWMVALGILFQYVFVMTYAIPDWHDFLTPVYVLFTPLIAMGLVTIWGEALRPLLERTGLTQVGLQYGAAGLILVGLLAAVLPYNLRAADQRGADVFMVHGQTVLDYANEDATLVMPSANSPAFYYSWAVIYHGFAMDRPLQAVASPEINPPPGPEPYYIAWPQAEQQIAADGFFTEGRQVLILDPLDPRAAGWGLLPICVGEAVAGYEVVSVEGEPIVDEMRWQQIRGAVIAPGEAPTCAGVSQ